MKTIISDLNVNSLFCANMAESFVAAPKHSVQLGRGYLGEA